MSTMQEQARALGDPTRHDIFRYVVDAERAGRRGRAHRPLRPEPQRDPAAPGQAGRRRAGRRGDGSVDRTGATPPEYVVDPGAESRWGVQGPYERLSLLAGRDGPNR